MTGHPVPSRVALSWHRARFSAVGIVTLVMVIVGVWNLPGHALTATTGLSATPGAMASPTGATPESMATPAAATEVSWSNGAVPIWTFETGTDYWADRLPPAGGGVFGIYSSNSNVFRVLDAETHEQLWTWNNGRSRYSWRPTEEAFFIAQGSQLTARAPRSGWEMWTHTVPDDEWDWTARVYGDSRSYVYITSDARLTVLDLASGEALFEANRARGAIRWDTVDGIMTLRNGHILAVVDLDAGKERWRYQGPRGTEINWTDVDGDWYVTSGGTLAVVDPATGTVHWQFSGSGETISWEREDDVLYLRSGHDVSALDLESGVERWRFSSNDDVTRVWVADDMLFARSDSAVSAIDPESGVERWRFTGTSEDLGLTTTDDAFYVYSGAVVSSLDPESGAELWRFGGSGVISALRVADGVVYARSDSAVSAIDPEGGGELWRYNMTGSNVKWWSFSEDEDDLYVEADSALALLDARTGIERWRVDASGEIHSHVCDDERCAFLAASVLVAVDPATGDELWRSEPLPENPWDFRFDTESDAYRVRADENVVIDATTGETLVRGVWEEQDGVIYNRSGDRVTAFDLEAREELWRYSADTHVSRFYLQDDLVLLVAGNAFVALDQESGAESWRFTTRSWITATSVGERVIRLSDDRGTLYALAAKPVQLEPGGMAVTTTQITLHGAPNPASVERGTLPAGVTVTITGQPDESDGVTWWPVTTGEAGEQGWAPAGALKPTSNAPAGTSTPAA